MISCGQNNLNFVSTVVKRWKTITIYCIKAHFNLREFKTLRGSLTLALALFHSSHLSRLLTGYFSLSLSLSLSLPCVFFVIFSATKQRFWLWLIFLSFRFTDLVQSHPNLAYIHTFTYPNLWLGIFYTLMNPISHSPWKLNLQFCISSFFHR